MVGITCRRGIIGVAAVLVAALGGWVPAGAGPVPAGAGPAAAAGGVRADGEVVVLYEGDPVEVPPILSGADVTGRAATATITVNWSQGNPSTAVRNAVNRAADLWETVIVSPVPITVDASWASLAPGALASAGAGGYVRDFPGAPIAGTFYPDPLVDALFGAQAYPGEPEIVMNVNSTANWYTGLDGNAGVSQYDLVSVALHELGHGLGFVTSFTTSGATASFGIQGYPIVLDRALERADGTKVISLGAGAMYTALTNGNLWLDLAPVLAVNGGQRPELYAPSPFEQGSSASHLDDDAFPAGDVDSLMTPFLGGGEVIHEPGPIAVGTLEGIGWDVNPPIDVPGAPTITASSGGDRSASVSWSPPADDGGSPITSYTVTAMPANRSVAVVGSRRSATITGLGNGVAQQVTVRATNAIGQGPASTAASVTPASPGPATGEPGYHPLVPVRVLDTRSGLGGPATQFGPTTTRTLDVTDTAGSGVPASGVSAVVLNVTATGASADSDIRLWPTGAAQPNASNLNIRPGATIPNLVTVGVGTGGTVQVRNQSGNVHLIADVVGWFDDGTTLGVPFTPLSPTRILDTRKAIGGPTAKVGAGATRVLDVTNTLGSGVPANGVTAVLLNVTATGASADTFLTLYPTGATRPQASNLNVTPARSIANLVAVAVPPSGTVTIYNSAGSVDVIADVVGWYGAAAESVFTPVVPSRRFDTRQGTPPGGPFATGEQRSVDVTGVSGVPDDATAVVVNVTATNTGADTFVTVWPSGVSRPLTSNLNVSAGWTLANLVVAKVGTDGRLALYDNTGPTDLIGDVVGWYGPPD